MQHDSINRADAQPAPRNETPGLRSDVYTLRGGGEVVLTLPDILSQRDYDDLQDWLDLMGRKAKRSVGEKPALVAETKQSESTEEEE